MANELEVRIEMEAWTCDYGHTYATPKFAKSDNFICPFCAVIDALGQDERNTELRNEVGHLERVIRSLRGALSRKKAKG